MGLKLFRKFSRWQRRLDWRGNRLSSARDWVNTEAGRKLLISAGVLALVLTVQRTDLAVARRMENGLRYVITARFDYAPVLQRLGSLSSLTEKVHWPLFPKLFGSNEESPVEPALGTATTATEAMVRERGILIPVSGELTSGYGYRLHPVDQVEDLHAGVDIAAPEGTPIVAALAGIVEQVSEEDGLGKTLRIVHGDGIETVYGHCATITLREGQFVQQGDQVGTVGSTGKSLGPHLHFEIRVDGVAIDPARIAGF
jgi:murein DD-endopeptidase MepM/ murein hydrolase activator NlpD